MAKDRFLATGEDGQVYTILKIITSPSPVRHFEGTAPVIGGQGKLQTTQGQTVNRIGKGEYQILETGVKLTSTDPEAP